MPMKVGIWESATPNQLSGTRSVLHYLLLPHEKIHVANVLEWIKNSSTMEIKLAWLKKRIKNAVSKIGCFFNTRKKREQAQAALIEGTKNRMHMLAEMCDFVGLEQAAREALLLDSSDPQILTSLAYSLQQQANYAEAVGPAIRAAEISPNLGHAHFLAGICLFALDDYERALKYLERAMVISPDNTDCVRALLKAVEKVQGVEEVARRYKQLSKNEGTQGVFLAAIRNPRDWANEQGVPVLEVGDIEYIPYKEPAVFGQPEKKDVTMMAGPQPHVIDIPDARIYGECSIILSRDGAALSYWGTYPELGHIVDFSKESVVVAQGSGKLLLDEGSYEKKEIDKAIMLSSYGSVAFGHWFPDFLPRLQFLQQHPEYASRPIIVDANMPATHFEHLRRLSSNPLVILKPNETLLCRHLLVACPPGFIPVHSLPNDIPFHKITALSARALRFLRKEVAASGTLRPNRRIFLARRKLAWRRLINEQEITESLAQWGFEAVYLEEMNVDEQIRIFQQVEWIVAPNGSSLLNLIFADISAKVVVLSQSNLFSWGAFQGPMESLGYRPIWVCSDCAAVRHEKHSDYSVPPDRVLQVLIDMGIGKGHR